MTERLAERADLPALTTPRPQPLNSSPADREIAAIIAALLLHYWAGQVSDGARASMARDWLDDLREFGPEIVAAACARWRHQPGGRRPTPGDIRTFCIEEQRERQDRQAAIEDKNRAQSGGIWEQWLYDLWGPASTGRVARQQAIEDTERRLRRAEDWRAAQLKAGTVPGFTSPAKALGVTATEYRPPPEALAAGRRELGLEPEKAA